MTIWDRLTGSLGAFFAPTMERPAQLGRPRARTGLRPLPREHAGEAVQRWANKTVEKVRYHVLGGGLRFLPWLDHYTEETFEIRAQYPVMLRDATVRAGFLTKVLAVCQLPMQVHPADPDNPRDRLCADFVKFAYERIGITEESGSPGPASAWAGTVGVAWSILSGGVMRGHSVSELLFEKEPIERGKFRGKRRWRALKSKDTNYLQLSIDAFRNVTAIRGTAYNAGKVFKPDDFVIYTYLPLFESPVGISDFRSAYAYFWQKDTFMKLRGLHLDRYTGPFLIGKYQTAEQKVALETAFNNARGGGWMTAPVTAMVDAVNLAVSGTTDFDAAIKYCDQQILIALVGAHLQVLEGQVSGARGDTEVHKETSELYQWLLAETLANVYQTQMVPGLVLENFEDVEFPRITLGSVSDQAMEARARLDKALQDLGLDLSKKDTYSYFSRPEPTDPDDILKPPGAGQPPGGPGDGPGGAGGLAGLLGGGGPGGGGEPEEEGGDFFGEGEPCKKGEASAKTGCTPASGGGGKKASSVVSGPPKTAKDAGQAMADALASIKPDVANDPELRARVAANWARELRGRVIAKGPDYDILQEGVQENLSNKDFAEIVAKRGPQAVILVKGEEKGARRAENIGATTLVHSHSIEALEPTTSPPKPGMATSEEGGGIAAVLRHEYAHRVFDQMSAEEQTGWLEQAQALFPESEPLKKELTIYAGRAVNRQEWFTEAFAIGTSPNYDPSAFSDRARKLIEITLAAAKGESQFRDESGDFFAEGQPCKRGEAASRTGCIPASGKGGKKKEKSSPEPKPEPVSPRALERYGLSPREAESLVHLASVEGFDPQAAAQRYATLSHQQMRTGWDLVTQAIADTKGAPSAPPRPRVTLEEARSHVEDVRANPTPEGIRDLAETLASMPVKDIRALQHELGIVAGGNKSALSQKVAREATRRLTVRQQYERQARTKGIRTQDLHTTARQVRQTYNEVADQANSMLQDARRQYAQLSDGGRLHRGMRAFKGGDYTQIPHFDQIAASLMSRYPELLGSDEQEASERLFDLLAAGPAVRMKHDESYEKAIDEIESYGVPEPRSRAKTATVDDEVPFDTEGLQDEEEPGFTGIDALGREWRDGELVARQEEPAPAAQPEAPARQPVTTTEPWQMTADQWEQEDRAVSREAVAADALRDSVLRKIKDRYKISNPGEALIEKVAREYQLPDDRTYWEVIQAAKDVPQTHKDAVKVALVAGKPVPPEVLADYPDLAQQYSPNNSGQQPLTQREQSGRIPVEGKRPPQEDRTMTKSEPWQMTAAEHSLAGRERARTYWPQQAALVEAAFKSGQPTGQEDVRVLTRKQVENLLRKHAPGMTMSEVDRGGASVTQTGLGMSLTKVGDQYMAMRIAPAGPNLTHRREVEQALAAGKPVPPEVLKDYPDLQRRR